MASLLVAVAVFLLFAAFVNYFLLSNKKHASNLPPGPKPLPLIGNAHQINVGRMFESFDQMKHQFGDLIYLSFFGRDIVVLNSFDVMKEAFVKQGENFAGRPQVQLFQVITGGYGYTTTEGAFWKEQRRHALHVLRDFGLGRALQEEKIEVEMECLADEFRKLMKSSLTGSIDVVVPIKFAVVNIIANILFGKRFEHGDPEFLDIQNRIRVIIQSFPKLAIFDVVPFLKHVPGLMNYCMQTPQQSVDVFKEFFRKQMKEHYENYEQDAVNTEGKHSDFLYAFIAAMKQSEQSGEPSNFTVDQCLYGMLDLFGAGFETTSTTISWFFVYMVHHPDVQDKMRAEIEKEGAGTPTWGNRTSFPYTNAVVAEVQRHANIVPTGIAHKNIKNATLNGYDIPAESQVIPNMYSIMRDPKIFPEPDKFNPQRFLAQDGSFQPIESVVPFSVGKRSCMGEGLARMELFIFMASIVAKFRIEPAASGKPSLVPDIGFTAAPRPFEVRVVPIE